jgi:hypothetical protein
MLSAEIGESIRISRVSIRLTRKKDVCPPEANIFGGNDSSGNTERSENFLDFYKISDWQVS